MRTFITLAFLVGATPVFAGAIDGTYSTVSEADCDSELLLRIDGTGNHSTTCSPESSSGSYETERVNISWQIQGYLVTVHMNSKSYVLTYNSSLPCSSFGKEGAGPGLVGLGSKYWRTPLECK